MVSEGALHAAHWVAEVGEHCRQFATGCCKLYAATHVPAVALMHGVVPVLLHVRHVFGCVGEHVAQPGIGVCWQWPCVADMQSVLRHCLQLPLTQWPTAQQRMLHGSVLQSTAATFTAWTDARTAQKRAMWGVMFGSLSELGVRTVVRTAL